MSDVVHQAVRANLARPDGPEHDVLADIRCRAVADCVRVVSVDTALFLHVLTLATGAQRVFEVGTGYGASALSIATAFGPDGRLFTVERNPARAAVAREFFARAGVGALVNVMVGDATRLVHKVAGPFDLIVQDGDDEQSVGLLDRLLALLRPGGVLVTHGSRRNQPYHERVAADPRLRTAFLPIGEGVAVSVTVKDLS